MKLVIFGLTVSSSWGNGHATLWRGLLRALSAEGHECVFFERDAPWYESTRDLISPEHFQLILFSDWRDIAAAAREQLNEADAGLITSYCADALEATRLLRETGTLSVFYDLDTPVTLARVAAGQSVPWIGEEGYRDFDLVFSYSGGSTLRELREKLQARRVRPLYGSVDPEIHRPVRPMRTPAGDRRIDLSYLGTYAADRQAALERLFLDPAQRSPDRTFLIGGSLYPPEFPWKPNIYFVPHVPPADHNAFYCSSGLTLNVTRQPMADSGYCPSGRIFEAAACGIPVLSDWWEGLDEFFEPGREILVARSPEDTIEALNSGSDRLREIGLAARERALDCHTATIRAGELIAALEEAASERGPERVTWGEAH